jgi:hypothetical protein
MNVSVEEDHATEYTAAVFYSFNWLRSYAKYIQFFVRVQLNSSFNTQPCCILSLCMNVLWSQVKIAAAGVVGMGVNLLLRGHNI